MSRALVAAAMFLGGIATWEAADEMDLRYFNPADHEAVRELTAAARDALGDRPHREILIRILDHDAWPRRGRDRPSTYEGRKPRRGGTRLGAVLRPQPCRATQETATVLDLGFCRDPTTGQRPPIARSSGFCLFTE